MRQTKVYGFEFGMVCLLLHFADIPTVSILFFADDMLTLAAKHLTYAQKQCKKQTNQELQKQFNGPCQTKSQSESDYKWMVLLIKLPNSQADTKKQAGETGVLLACTNIFFLDLSSCSTISSRGRTFDSNLIGIQFGIVHQNCLLSIDFVFSSAVGMAFWFCLLEEIQQYFHFFCDTQC